MKKLVIVLLGLNLLGCSTTEPKRSLASVETHSDMVELFDKIELAVEQGVSSTKECSITMDYYYNQLLNTRSQNFDPQKLKYSELNKIIKTSFKTRIHILEELKHLSLKSTYDKTCLTKVKDVVRALRYVEDYFIEVRYTRSGELENKNFTTLEGDGMHFLINPKFPDFQDHMDLKSGDIILSRGNAYSSAAIARIGKNDTQFSHLTLVYVDDNEKMHTIEAHIEIGNVVAPFDVHLNQKNARTVVYRHKDSDLAHRAAKIMHDRVKKQQDTGKNIPYDFAMDYHDISKIFCSEVVYWGYRLAAKEDGIDFDMPIHKTKFNKGLIPFLNILGININDKNYKVFDTFGPGDIQFDSRFDMVAEWRNPHKMKDTRYKDAILTKLFEWMEKDGYMFKHSSSVSVTSNLFWLMRKVPYLNEIKDLKKQFPLNMSVDQLKLFRTLDVVADKFLAHLEEVEKENGKSLTPMDMYISLEKFMREDAKKYIEYKKYKKEKRFARSNYERRTAHRKMKKAEPSFHINFHN